VKTTNEGRTLAALRLTITAFAPAGSFGMASAQDPAAVEAGEALYSEHCAECHGENLRSSSSVPDLRDLRQDQRGYFDQIVTDGKGQMPAWGGVMNEPELNQLWAYIRAHAR
jgi:mono/diheme cytochrome c family protein